MKRLMFVFVLLINTILSLGQNIEGKVVNSDNIPLIGASVLWEGTLRGVVTNTGGEFSIPESKASYKLIVSYVGYKKDTINVVNYVSPIQITLLNADELDEVVVKAKYNNVYISDITPIKTESITKGELRKAACCDLAGCFETQTTVQAKTTNVITNSKELRILGLSGVYNQVLIDGLPLVQGLNYTYGISSYPGTLVENIFVSKGANSVLQGFESISGQINVITANPENSEKLFLNAYINSFAEKQFNLSHASSRNKLNYLIAFHTTQPANKIDGDNDQFIDLPLLTRYMVFNKLQYGNDQKFGLHSQTSIRYTNEQRIGGQTFFNKETDKGTSNAYGQIVSFYQPDITGKTGYRVNADNDFSLFYSGFYQNQDSYFGTTHYKAEQVFLYLKFQHDLNYGKTHNLKSGITYRHSDITEQISFTEPTLIKDFDGKYLNIENVIGFYTENTLSFFNNKLSWIVGIRGDYQNSYGTKFSPRTLLKVTPLEGLTIRANFGTGWRTVNLFSENINLLVSSRNVVFNEKLEPEEAINYGLNITYKFAGSNFTGYLTADAYRTEFQNQIFPDYDTNPTVAYIQNYKGESVSNGFQIDGSLKIFNQYEIKAGYGYLDVYKMVNNKKVELPFNAKDRLHVGLSYATKSEKIQFDANYHWFGKQRLPDTRSNPVEYQRPDYSETYSLINAQITYNFSKFELYFGSENILDTRQEKPIISWEDPFSQYFDTSSVWGLTKGREFYLGIRFKI